jgi:hypothetical protein
MKQILRNAMKKEIPAKIFIGSMIMLTSVSIGFGYWLAPSTKTVQANDTTIDELIEIKAREYLASQQAHLLAKEGAIYEIELQLQHLRNAITVENNKEIEKLLQKYELR